MKQHKQTEAEKRWPWFVSDLQRVFPGAKVRLEAYDLDRFVEAHVTINRKRRSFNFAAGRGPDAPPLTDSNLRRLVQIIVADIKGKSA